MSVDIDTLFAKVTMQEQRSARAARRHERKMAWIDGMTEENRAIVMSIKMLVLLACVVTLVVGGGCTAASLHNHLSDNQRKQACEVALATHHMPGDCGQDEIHNPKYANQVK
jgi:hypothetical protein